MSYWSERTDRFLIEQENARAARMAALQDALYRVRHEDDDVLTEDTREILRQAQTVVDELHAIW